LTKGTDQNGVERARALIRQRDSTATKSFNSSFETETIGGGSTATKSSNSSFLTVIGCDSTVPTKESSSFLTVTGGCSGNVISLVYSVLS
jgi:hypothetical protein